MFVPGGGLQVAALGVEVPDGAGISTGASGDIHIFSRDSVVVNRSRVLTFEGGDVVIGTPEGDIESGRGAKTSRSALAPEVFIDVDANTSLRERAGREFEECQQCFAILGQALDCLVVKLAVAQKQQAELLRMQRELGEKERELDLTIEKKVQAGLADVRTKAKQEAEDALKLKVSEEGSTDCCHEQDDRRTEAEGRARISTDSRRGGGPPSRFTEC